MVIILTLEEKVASIRFAFRALLVDFRTIAADP